MQLPGVQDTAKAKDIIGRTATLEVRMVEQRRSRGGSAGSGPVPFGTERYRRARRPALILKRQVILTGEPRRRAGRLRQPDPGATVNLTLDAKGARIFRDVTARERGQAHGHPAVRKGQGEVVTAPVIRSEIGGGAFRSPAA